MKFKLVIDNVVDRYELTEFKEAINTIEEVYGYSGPAWEIVVAKEDIREVYEFLLDDGVDADLFIA